MLALRLSKVIKFMTNEEQAEVVKGRQRLDAILMANEAADDYRLLKKSGYIFKVDYGKAYDHVVWAFVDFVLEKKCFGLRWRKWIHYCQWCCQRKFLLFFFVFLVDVLGSLTVRARTLGLV